MKNQKQSDVAFLMMKDWREQLEMLTNEQKGIILSAIYDYQCDGLEFVSDDPVLAMLWANVRRTFEINSRKYEEMCERNRENIKKRWAKKDTTVYDRNLSYTKNTDTDKDTDTETDTDTDTVRDTEIEKEREAETELTAAAFSDTSDIMKRFDELVSSKYQREDLCERDSVYSYITLGEMFALYDLIDEQAVERYLDKASEYKAKSPAKMILRWAYDDNTLI
ncbi:MAG: hypothetical protein IKF64_07725 [Eubacterium sp.]|nr:hypothetical protein [Eubacterium sp.]